MKTAQWIALVPILVLQAAPAWAFRFSPMVAELSPQGQKSSQTFLVENNGDARVALQLELFKRTADEDGIEKRVITEDLSVFPQQLTLEPGAQRNIKVSWVGGAAIDSERPYRLVVTQLPVDFAKIKGPGAKPGVNLNFLLQYVASLYVVPPQAKARVVVASIARLEGGSLKVALTNAGNAHQLLRGMRLRIGPGKSEVSADQLKILESDNLLPGASRSFTVTLPLPLPTGALAGTAEFPPS